jgi:cyclic-di-AMP phosphodiesterase PgpH
MRYRIAGEHGYRVVMNERLSGFREWLVRRDHRRFGMVMLAILVVGITLVVSSKYLPSPYAYHVGEVASGTIAADRTISFADTASTDALRKQVAALTEPARRSVSTALGSAIADTDALMGDIAAARAQMEVGGSASGSSAVLSPGQALALVRRRAPPGISDATLSYLLTAPPAALEQLRAEARSAFNIIYAGNVPDTGLEAARAKLRGLADGADGSAQFRDAVYEVASTYLLPNQVFDAAQTQARRDQAMAEVAPVVVTLFKGELVVGTGDKITPEVMLRLEALGLTDSRPSWEIWLGTLLLVILELVVIVGLVSRSQPALLKDNIIMLAMTTLMLFFVGLARLLVIPPLSPYAVPLAALAMLTSILTRPRTALLLVSMLAIDVGLLAGFDFYVTMVLLLTAVFSLYSVSRLAQRLDLLTAGLLVMVVAGAAVFAGELLQEVPVVSAFKTSLWGLGNGLLSLVITLSLLLVYETVFNLTTPLRLLELANPSQPLLRRLMQVAPGTYNHSILMGNLAGAAAEAIDADPLLARIGAYYHDIGKILRPEYFVENQLHVTNPHDKLTPNLSKLAITAHVRDGKALARAYGLPQPIIDIIEQHHGTSVLSFFYHKAKEASKTEVAEEAYRYDGKKPTSPEAAIIMLADSVEAAAKAMKSPTVKKMQDLIRDIFKQKMDDAQLDDAQLTLGDLHKIRDVFESGLRGLAGHRIAYPKEENHAERTPEQRLARAAAGGGAMGGVVTASGRVPRAQKPQLRSLPATGTGMPEPDEPSQPAKPAQPDEPVQLGQPAKPDDVATAGATEDGPPPTDA